MQIQMTGRHMDLTDALKEYAQEKIQKLTQHYDHILKAGMTFWVENNQHFVETKLSVPGNEIVASAHDSTMYAAIDALQNKLNVQVKKYKTKTQNHHVDRNVRNALVAGAPEDLLEDVQDDELIDVDTQIVFSQES